MPTTRSRQPSHHHPLRDVIERSIRARRTQEGTPARALEDVLKGAGAAGWKLMSGHPYLGSAAVAAGAVVAAGALGAAELGLGALAAYTTYQVLTGRETFSEAVRQVLKEPEEAR